MPSHVLEKFLQDNPQFHYYQGRCTSWGVHPDALRFLHGLLLPGASTLETGCGHTTVVFAIAGTRHICVTPDPEEAHRVKSYCAGLGLPDNITFLVGSSDQVLSKGEVIPEILDHIVIDGAHRFPFPILDWHYTSGHLKIGGILTLDDYLMPSVRTLYDFLCAENEWKLIKTFENTAFFRKVAAPNTTVDWQHQKINEDYQATPGQSKTKELIESL